MYNVTWGNREGYFLPLLCGKTENRSRKCSIRRGALGGMIKYIILNSDHTRRRLLFCPSAGIFFTKNPKCGTRKSLGVTILPAT